MNKRYLFLLAWVAGSDGEKENIAHGSTNVRVREDLKKEYRSHNEHIFALEISAPNYTFATAIGFQMAFLTGYTVYNTLSYCEEIKESAVYKTHHHIAVGKDGNLMVIEK